MRTGGTRLGTGLAALALLAGCTPAPADRTPVTPSPRQVVVGATTPAPQMPRDPFPDPQPGTPAVVHEPGPHTVTLLLWDSGSCPPVIQRANVHDQVLVVRLSSVETFAPCTADLRPYRTTLTLPDDAPPPDRVEVVSKARRTVTVAVTSAG